MSRFAVVIVDDEKTLARSIKLFLEEQGHEAEVANDGASGLALVERMQPDLVFLDLRLPKIGGIELLRKIRESDPSIAAVMMTAHGTIEGAVEAMKLGAFDYLTKPVDLDEVKLLVDRIRDDRRLRQEVRYFRDRDAREVAIDSLVGRTPQIQSLLSEARRLASLPEPPAVLITGETGTGKSLIARALHGWSPRAKGPFIEIDCTSLPATLVETELFGHEKGSFTDAGEARVGLIEAADGGTALLDEIGDLSAPLQGKLLRVIEERTVRRVGSVRDRHVDTWIVAATNKDLPAMLAADTFRKDLYYRLAVVTLHVPPLRDRLDDVAPISDVFVKRFNAKYAKRVSKVSAAALESLRAYDWPGNVRELRHAIERAVLQSSATAAELGVDDFVPLRSAVATPPPDLPEGSRLADWERGVIERALEEAGGNQTNAARRLGVTRDTLRYRMGKFGIKGTGPAR